MSYDRPAAPEPLARVEEFCNSARFLYDQDAWADLTGAREWLAAHAGPATAGEIDDHGLAELVRLREAIRDHLDGSTAAQVHDTLNTHAERSLRPPRWSPDGMPLIPPAGGSALGEFVGGLLATLALEEVAGRRDRLKVCGSPDCRWVFYDRSPGNKGVWCSMRTCGARHKMRAMRERRSGGSSGGQA
ncbi:CGNR zinc finger domain-containing protein [Actinopolymorpha rutila]|uniref:Putative RNA-binding Zn ribbon-like protein n=1 Tax=Actinopolymorpha rutila TaxID=446787 RepID=A0A852ZCI6_9ACTN|nr:CGNR zinc finger domain-containing protein [Actinopolymorpha rutila]NYH90013.1 putative RNA-binding Zn ribbon-like protein [Actinopolymorpha rutila]